jgi:putative transcriptional regulator
MSRSNRTLAFIAGALMFLVFAAPAVAQDIQDTVMLVAKRDLKDPIFGASVVIVKPMRGGVHLGFLLNKPTKMTLGEFFPDHEASRKAASPVFIGGPVDANMIFALVQRADTPGQGSVQLTDELYAALSGDTVDKVIATEPKRARFVFGTIIWRAGQLQEELRRGMWHVTEPETDVVIRPETDGLWEKLVKKLEDVGRML